MSNPYDRAKGGKLVFKGGVGPERSIHKKKKKLKKTKKSKEEQTGDEEQAVNVEDNVNATSTPYTIDAATRKNYQELFPVEAKKFGYASSNPKSVEDALDERVKKKADRYCK